MENYVIWYFWAKSIYLKLCFVYLQAWSTKYCTIPDTRRQATHVLVLVLLIMCMKKTHWCKSTCRTQFIAQQCRLGRGRAVIPGLEAGIGGGGAGNSGAPLAGPSHPQSRSVISPATTLAIKYFLMLKYFLCCIRWVLPGNQSSESGASHNVVASVQRRIDRTDSR